MALVSEKQYNTFIKGLITEASPLTFPENSSLEEANFVLERNGSRSRRLGLDFEAGYGLKDTEISEEILKSSRVSFYKWDSPGGNTDLALGVVRVYNKFWFIDLLNVSPSATFLNGGDPITIEGLENSLIDTAVITNNFMVVSKDLPLPVLLKYDSTLDSVSQQTIEIKIRDFWGLDDGLDITERPTVLSGTHKYNLINQGWSSSVTPEGGTDALLRTFQVTGVYPSNADLWYVAKNENPSSGDYQKYSPSVLIRRNTDNALAPRGAAIIDAFNRGASRTVYSLGTDIPLDKETGSFTTVASYASRVFYSGVSSSVIQPDRNSPNYNGYIFYSQIVTSEPFLGKCYQEADPTSEEQNDLVDTDGGTIHIPEVTQILKLIPSKGSLLIFAENGIWELYNQDAGFKATGFSLSKVSAIGILNKDAVVESNGEFLCWTTAGIYLLKEDQVSGRYFAENISLNTIQTFYNNLSDICKSNARAFFDERQNRVRWLFNDSEDYSESNYINYYNKELILDLTLGAFYLNTFSDLEENSPKVTSYVGYPGYAKSILDTPVYVGNDSVIVTDTSPVVISQSSIEARGSQFGFLTFVGESFTISKFNSRTFTDWSIAGSGEGADYTSYMVTGYELFGDSVRNKQVPYVVFFFERTEDGFSEVDGNLEIDNPSACVVQAQWDWANSSRSGKWGRPFQAYKFKRNYIPSGASDTFDYGQRVISTKNKLRGSGKALSLLISSEPGKDMRLLGWTAKIEADEVL